MAADRHSATSRGLEISRAAQGGRRGRSQILLEPAAPRALPRPARFVGDDRRPPESALEHPRRGRARGLLDALRQPGVGVRFRGRKLAAPQGRLFVRGARQPVGADARPLARGLARGAAGAARLRRRRGVGAGAAAARAAVARRAEADLPAHDQRARLHVPRDQLDDRVRLRAADRPAAVAQRPRRARAGGARRWQRARRPRAALLRRRHAVRAAPPLHAPPPRVQVGAQAPPQAAGAIQGEHGRGQRAPGEEALLAACQRERERERAPKYPLPSR